MLTDDLERLRSELRRRTQTEATPQAVSVEQALKRLRLRARDRTEGDPCLVSAVIVAKAAHQVGVAAAISGRKMWRLTNSLLRAADERDFFVLALVARSMIEHAGIAAHLTRVTLARVDDARRNPQPDALDAPFAGLRKKLEQFFSGSGVPGAPLRPIHVNDGLKDLEAIAGGAQGAYDFLCDYVHPNFGTNLLVSTGVTIDDVVLDPVSMEHLGPFEERVVAAAALAFEIVRQCVFRLLSACFAFEELAERLVHKTTKSPAHATRATKLVVENDGLTPATAWRFPTARTFKENIEFLEMLSERDQFTLGERALHGFHDGRLVDHYQTSAGARFVSMPMREEFADDDEPTGV